MHGTGDRKQHNNIGVKGRWEGKVIRSSPTSPSNTLMSPPPLPLPPPPLLSLHCLLQ